MRLRVSKILLALLAFVVGGVAIASPSAHASGWRAWGGGSTRETSLTIQFNQAQHNLLEVSMFAGNSAVTATRGGVALAMSCSFQYTNPRVCAGEWLAVEGVDTTIIVNVTGEGGLFTTRWMLAGYNESVISEANTRNHTPDDHWADGSSVIPLDGANSWSFGGFMVVLNGFVGSSLVMGWLVFTIGLIMGTWIVRTIIRMVRGRSPGVPGDGHDGEYSDGDSRPGRGRGGQVAADGTQPVKGVTADPKQNYQEWRDGNDLDDFKSYAKGRKEARFGKDTW